ncbi:MAG: AI-2E family transporter [Mollicutes bacterium]|nr:AI-2E family transporter [Mollicutes bacterium]
MKNENNIDKKSLNELIHLSKNLIKFIYVVSIVGIVLAAFSLLNLLNAFTFIKGMLRVLSPLFIGFIIAWLFYPIQKKLTNKGMNKVLSSLLIILCLAGVIFIFMYIFVPVLTMQINDFISSVPNIYKSVADFITNTINKIHIKGLDTASFKDGMLSAIQDYIKAFTMALPNGVLTFAKNFFSTVGVILISFVIAIYMLIDFENIANGFYKLFKTEKNKEAKDLIQNIGTNARRVVNGTIFVAFMVFVFDTIGFALAGLNSAVLFGFLCGVTDLIPYIGPYIGGGIAVIVAFTQSPLVGVTVLIIAIVVQLLESYVLQPVIMSKAMELSPVLIISGLLLFGHFGGIIGMIIATPCMAIMKEIIRFICIKRKEYIKKRVIIK